MRFLFPLLMCLSFAFTANAGPKKAGKAKPAAASPIKPEVAPAPVDATPDVAPPFVLPSPTSEPSAPPPTAIEGEGARIGVIDFQAPTELQHLANALSGYVANELQRLGAFRVTTTDQLRAMLSVERQAQLLGCPDDSCQGQIATSLGFDDLVTGKLARLQGSKGATYTLELVLIDQSLGKRVQSDVISAATEADLLSRIPTAVTKLVGTLLKGRQGTLVLATAETAATVKVDDSVMGVTPVGQMNLAAGPHQVSVEKEGFVTWRKEVRIKPSTLTEEAVSMVPSPDFISAYRSKQLKLRIGAFASAGVAAAGIGVGIAMVLRAQSLYGRSETEPNTFLFARRQVLNGIEMADGVNYRDMANKTKAQISTAQTLSYVGFAVAGAAAVASATMFVLGESPNRYDMYRTTVLKPRVSIFLSPGNAFAQLLWIF